MARLPLRGIDGRGVSFACAITGARFDLSYRGAGSVVIVGQLNLAAKGVDDVDTRRLLAQDADVNFKGIGLVRVYASNKREANLQGMGEPSYYGYPKSVSKSVSGLAASARVNKQT